MPFELLRKGGHFSQIDYEDFFDASEALRFEAKKDLAEVLLMSTTERNKQGVKRINQEMKNLNFYLNDRLFELKKETEEDFDKAWDSLRSVMGVV